MKPVKEQNEQSNEEEDEMLEKIDNEVKKEMAKIGMTATLGATVVTAPFLKGNKLMKNVHTGAGVLLVGFSLWHHLLYQADKKKKITKEKVTASDD